MERSRTEEAQPRGAKGIADSLILHQDCLPLFATRGTAALISVPALPGMMQPKTVAPCLLPRLQADLPDLDITLVYLNLSMPITLTLTCATVACWPCFASAPCLLLGQAVPLHATKLHATKHAAACGSTCAACRHRPCRR